MKLTNMFEARRRIVDRLDQLATEAGPDTPMHGVQVAYSYPGPPNTYTCLWADDPPAAERLDDEPPAELDTELASVSLHIRSFMAPTPDVGLRYTDQVVEAIGDEIATLIHAERAIAGPGTYAAVVAYRPMDASHENAAVSLLMIQIGVKSTLSEG